MFGPIMQFSNGQHDIRLAPLRRDEMEQFVTDGGMQTHSVTRYLGMQFSPVLEDEYDWYDKVRQDESSRTWGIYVLSGENWLLIGTTGLHGITGRTLPYATSGCQIFRKEWWGKRIAGTCHRARTMYAFDQLGLSMVRSAVMTGNDASYKALQRIGYVQVAVERNQSFRDGRWAHKRNLEMVNPSTDAWRSWWHGDHVPQAFRAARQQTTEALDWARQEVTLL